MRKVIMALIAITLSGCASTQNMSFNSTSCTTDMECMMTPDCMADPTCDGGPQP